jgi:hypothetical protein
MCDVTACIIAECCESRRQAESMSDIGEPSILLPYFHLNLETSKSAWTRQVVAE